MGRIVVWGMFLAVTLGLYHAYSGIESSYPLDTRPFEEQKFEAMKTAKRGHHMVLNREACKKLEPGDIILYDKQLWSVRYVCSLFLRMGNCQSTGFQGPKLWWDYSDFSPEHLGHIYKMSDGDWYQAAVMLNLQGLPRRPITPEVLKHIRK